MKTKYLHVRVTDKRLEKLRTIAMLREKTLTSMVEDWIDQMPKPDELES